MEIIKDKNNYTPQRPKRNSGYFIALLFIIGGLFILGKNLNLIEPKLLNILLSWQMIVIIVGLWSICRKQVISGLFMIGIGAFFLIPKFYPMANDWLRIYWPLLLVIFGIMLIVKRSDRKCEKGKKGCYKDVLYDTEDGFINSEIIFGSVKHIVLEPVFKGAVIKSTFAGTAIDLRNTTLEADETVIEVDSTFGGIEIYAPASWCIILDLKPVFGGSEDKRRQVNSEIDYKHKLIIRGKLSFSGLEIKS